MKVFLFLINLICILTILVNRIFVNAINITNTSNTGYNVILTVLNLSLLLNTTSVCIISESEKVVYSLLELFKHDYKPVVIVEDPLVTCVFIRQRSDMTVRACRSISYSYQTSVVYVSTDSIIPAPFMPRGLSVAQSQEVLALSLSDGSLFQLSPVFPQPRHFVRTSVREVLQRRVDMNSKKLDLQGSTLSIGSLYYFPLFINMGPNSTSNVPDQHDGVYAELVEEMARRFNFSYSYILYLYYGSALNNGTWEEGGLGKVIQEGRVDIISTGNPQTPEFYDIMDFGPALNKGKLGFLVMRPEVIDFQWEAVLQIFKPKVWLGVLLSFLLTVLMYWAGVNWGPQPYKESLSGCMLTVFGFFTSSTSHRRVDEGSTRFSLVSWSVFSVIITTFLSTGIVTRLTVPSYSPRIDSVEQLVKGEYFWTAQFYADYINSTSLKESLFNLENHWIQQFEKRYVYTDPEELTITAGTDKKMAYVVLIYGHEYVFLETDGIDGLTALKKYRVTRDVFTEYHVSLGVKKQSFLLEPVTDFTLQLLQAGLVTRWMDDVNRRWPLFDYTHLLVEQDIPTFSEPKGLTLNKVQPVFFLLLFGLGLASFAFFIEIFWTVVESAVSGIKSICPIDRREVKVPE